MPSDRNALSPSEQDEKFYFELLNRRDQVLSRIRALEINLDLLNELKSIHERNLLDRNALSPSEQDEKFYSDVLDRREQLLSRTRALEINLDLLNELIAIHERSASISKEKLPRQLKEVPPKQQRGRRVRGVLAAARKAVEELPEPFNKKQLLELVEKDQELAGKVSDANIRNALRILINKGVIHVAHSATPISCAQFVKAS